MMIMLLHLNMNQALLVIQKATAQKGVKIAVTLKYLNNFWKSLEMPLINCRVELSLTRNGNCVLATAANASNETFKITDTKLYVQFLLCK